MGKNRVIYYSRGRRVSREYIVRRQMTLVELYTHGSDMRRVKKDPELADRVSAMTLEEFVAWSPEFERKPNV